MGALPPSTSPLTATETFRPAREKVTESPPTLWPAEAAKTSPPDCGRFRAADVGPALLETPASMIPPPLTGRQGDPSRRPSGPAWYLGVILPAVPVGVVIGLASAVFTAVVTEVYCHRDLAP